MHSTFRPRTLSNRVEKLDVGRSFGFALSSAWYPGLPVFGCLGGNFCSISAFALPILLAQSIPTLLNQPIPTPT